MVWLYRSKVVGVFSNATRDPVARQMLVNLAIAFVPAALTGFLIYDWMKETLFNPVTVAWALLVGCFGSDGGSAASYVNNAAASAVSP